MFESLKLYKSQAIRLDDLLGILGRFGYHKADMVSLRGDFSYRGGVVDIYPLGFEDPLRLDLLSNKINAIKTYDISTGNSVDEHQNVILLPIKETPVKRLKLKPLDLGLLKPIDNFVDIDEGDHIVHTKYGIGVYRGIKELRIKKDIKPNLIIEYAGGDILYVPQDDIEHVQKYIGVESRPPKLSKLGGTGWSRIKQKVFEGCFAVARDLLEIQAKRESLSGFKFSPDTEWQKILEDEFPYEETPDQLKATAQIKLDMESPKPMDRLICGDVGYGKTEVALRAAFKAVMDNKQVAILVPTTILAEQHYNTFKERFKKFPVNIAMLSRFVDKSQRQLILKSLYSGDIDVVIGTHMLLSGKILFKDMGLLIIDEEQRFGVAAKERLKKMRSLVDVLTLTATPIPRTLYMSMLGIRDISTINSPPAQRLPIETKVCQFSPQIIKQVIERELKRSGQIYFVQNHIEGIEKIAKDIQTLVPKVRLAVAHGQIASRNLEAVMFEFINKKIDMLISTNIIESGIDIPNANTIIINQAEKFGLADLYQLRGRVGRFKKKAYAYLIVSPKKILDSGARKKLETIEKFTELGSGFKIAMKDLEVRGAGNLLGIQQHGYIEQVGFDLYCRLLKEAACNLSKKR